MTSLDWNCVNVSDEIGCEENDMPPPPDLAQQMLSNRLNNLLIIPKKGDAVFNHNGSNSSSLSFFERNYNGRGSSYSKGKDFNLDFSFALIFVS